MSLLEPLLACCCERDGSRAQLGLTNSCPIANGCSERGVRRLGMADSPPSNLARASAVWQLIYSEVQYWCIGLTPESYHWAKGNAWDVLRNHRRAVFHLARFLRFTDNAYVRGRLAHGYACLGLWTEASQQYERVNQKYPQPEFALGHARAELRRGNKARAAEILAAVTATYSLDQRHMEDAAFLREELQHGWKHDTPREVGRSAS